MTKKLMTTKAETVQGTQPSARHLNRILLMGGCHCRAIRYQAEGFPFDADYCHCLSCQKTIGAAFGAWMDFKFEQITWLSGAPTLYHSSKAIVRGFCPQCGTSLSYASIEHPQYLTLSIATLDDANQVQPRYHIHTQSQLTWLTITDTCQRYLKERI